MSYIILSPVPYEDLDSSAVTRLIDRLEKEKLLKRHPYKYHTDNICDMAIMQEKGKVEAFNELNIGLFLDSILED